MEDNEQSFIPFGGELAVFDNALILPPKEAKLLEKAVEGLGDKRLIDLWNSLDNVSFPINPSDVLLRGDKND
ncbi:hypothetical protein ACIQ1D_18980 [Lysinibacillus xylanilyticus]|uniref:hypothetical protein n=1 Tax=Lysinibacillus xylanilyticus TaxID=582475 RepID=UPI00382D570E